MLVKVTMHVKTPHSASLRCVSSNLVAAAAARQCSASNSNMLQANMRGQTAELCAG